MEGPAISKPNRELAQAILGGEMKNAWQKTVPGESRDMRPLTSKARLSRVVTEEYRDHYEQIFGRK